MSEEQVKEILSIAKSVEMVRDKMNTEVIHAVHKWLEEHQDEVKKAQVESGDSGELTFKFTIAAWNRRYNDGGKRHK